MAIRNNPYDPYMNYPNDLAQHMARELHEIRRELDDMRRHMETIARFIRFADSADDRLRRAYRVATELEESTKPQHDIKTPPFKSI